MENMVPTVPMVPNESAITALVARHAAPAQPAPVPPGAEIPAAPCPTCYAPNYWLDAYGYWHCELCQPPPADAMVRDAMVRERTQAGLDPALLRPLPPHLADQFGPPIDCGPCGFWREWLRATERRVLVRVGWEDRCTRRFSTAFVDTICLRASSLIARAASPPATGVCRTTPTPTASLPPPQPPAVGDSGISAAIYGKEV